MNELVRVCRGVSRTPSEVADLRGRCLSLLSALPSGTLVAGLAAARLHGLWVPSERPGEPIDVIMRGVGQVPRARSASSHPEVRARRRWLRRPEIDIVDGVPVTSEARTWVDLAESLRLADLVAAGDSVLRGGAATRRELELYVLDAAGRRGVVAARAALELLDERSRSRPESHLRFGLVSSGLPWPEVNEAIFDDLGQWIAEPDLHYPHARLSLEYNGAGHADVDRMRKDITRGVDVARAEWMTLTFGAVQVFGRLEDSVSVVRTYLDARDPAWRTRPRGRPTPTRTLGRVVG